MYKVFSNYSILFTLNLFKESLMQETIKEIYSKYIADGDLFDSPAANVLVILVLALLVLWIFSCRSKSYGKAV